MKILDTILESLITRSPRSFLILIVFCIIALLGFSYSAHAITLRQNNVIMGHQITLGDIFSGLQAHNAKRVLGAAPHPGKDMVLNARTLMRIAIAMDVSWHPSSSTDYIVLSSAATLIDKDMIEDKLKINLRDQGLSGDFNLILSNDSATNIVLPHDEDQNVAVQELKLNRKRDWFTAVMVAPSLDNPLQRVTVSGRIERTVNLPVLSTNLRKGALIGKSDIDYIKVTARNINQDYILDPQDLIGMTPKRVILSGQPIKAVDIDAPLMVERGKSVTMIFEEGGLRLTALGKALQNGAEGDLIRVVNSNSNRTIEAVITGSQEVTIKTFN